MSGKLRVLVADDELMARERLLRLLSELPDVQAYGECRNATQVLQRGRGRLLDISMPGLTGMEALRLMPQNGPDVVFCTARAAHAVDAFDAWRVLDYLLKPVEAARLEKTLQRAHSRESLRRFIRGEADRQRTPPKAPVDRLAIETRLGIALRCPSELAMRAKRRALRRIFGLSKAADDAKNSGEGEVDGRLGDAGRVQLSRSSALHDGQQVRVRR